MRSTPEELSSLVANRARIILHRTLRIPDDGNTYALPPSMGSFPIYRASDFLGKVPSNWKTENSYFFPMYQREAMWIDFQAGHNCAIQVGVGKVNAVSGDQWDKNLVSSPQNYVVGPNPQKWLDGINSGTGTIKQFVAMPLGGGYTVEGQVTGKEEFGGIQIAVYPPKYALEEEQYRDIIPGSLAESLYTSTYKGMSMQALYSTPMKSASGSIGRSIKLGGGRESFELKPDSGVSAGKVAAQMGLAAGGKMHQKVYPDPYGIDTWDPLKKETVWVYICNIPMFQEITGLPAPKCPISAKDYQSHGYPWFDLYDESYGDVSSPITLQDVKSVATLDGINESGDSFNTPDNQVTKYPMPKKVYGAPAN
jgi:hypothetical protein